MNNNFSIASHWKGMIFLHNPPSFKASCEPSPLKWRSFGLWAAISLCGCPWILLGFGFFFRSKSRSATQLVGVTWRFHKHLQPMAWNMKQQDRDNGNAKKQRTVNGIYIYIRYSSYAHCFDHVFLVHRIVHVRVFVVIHFNIWQFSTFSTCTFLLIWFSFLIFSRLPSSAVADSQILLVTSWILVG